VLKKFQFKAALFKIAMLNFALDHGAVGVKGSKNRYFAEIQV